MTPERHLAESLLVHRVKTDRMFAWLLAAQWFFAIVLAFMLSPYSASGGVHFHLKAAVCIGGLLTGLPITLTVMRPGQWETRHMVAASQMLWSALLIMITGGRIETHFHIFGSLAFLAFYRDWRVLVTATGVVVADHLARGLMWPDSVYGASNPEWWRFLEHAAWVVFEDTVLVVMCRQSMREMRVSASRQASVETEVQLRTRELEASLAHVKQLAATEKQLEVELRQAQKLESVGRLAAGIAHEINTPIQYIGDSLAFVREAIGDLPTADPEERDYLDAQIPIALTRGLDGIARVARIVRSMKVFAHPDQPEMTAVDLNEALASTFDVARNEYKYVADVDLALASDLPSVCCHAGQINQVFLNLVVNAAHAIGDAHPAGTRGRIAATTRRDGDSVVIAIADSGAGIPEAIRDHVFEPFFTTKPVGKGTGQGLAIAHSVIDRHRGSLTFESVVGIGTTFFVRLPITAAA